MRDDEILLDVHEVVDRDGAEFGELDAALFEEDGDRVALLALRERVSAAKKEGDDRAYSNDLAMTVAVPVRVGLHFERQLPFGEARERERTISISSSFMSSCICNHFLRSSSRSVRSASSRSRSGRK